MRRILSRAMVLPLLLAVSVPATGAKPPDTWDGLLRVGSTKLDSVYLLPGADFRTYNKVMLDPTEIAFRKNWQRDQNTAQINTDTRISNSDAREILERAKTDFDKVFAEAYQKAGYQVVTTPGPDVLRVSTAVINLDVVAPDTMSAGRSWTFSREAGSATLVLEARDSQTGAVLGRAVDARSTGDSRPYIRNSVTNSSEFEALFKRWAQLSVNGLAELKQQSPVDADGIARK
jgi:hypothetical protein